MGAWAVCSFHSLISTQTFRRALTASVNSGAEVKSVPSLAEPILAEFGGRKVPESDARSVGLFVHSFVGSALTGTAHQTCPSKMVKRPGDFNLLCHSCAREHWIM